MTERRWLLPLLFLVSSSFGCIGHQPLTGAGASTPIMVGPVRALGDAGAAPAAPRGEQVSLIELDQHIIFPVAYSQPQQLHNAKSAATGLATLQEKPGQTLVVNRLQCRAFMHLFVRSTWCAAEGALVPTHARHAEP